MPSGVSIREVISKRDRLLFVKIAYSLNGQDANWVPPLRSEVAGLVTPGSNPWFEHAKAAFFIAERDGQAVGRISAQIDTLVQQASSERGGGIGTGHWGMMEAVDSGVAGTLISQAEDWLRGQGMVRSVGPISLSIWDEPGLLIQGHDHPPTVMMSHNNAAYERWIEACGYARMKDLRTYDLDITKSFPAAVQRVIASGQKNHRIRVRTINKRNFTQEALLILGILNDAWSSNWGFVPLTDAEIAYAGKKLKPVVFNDLVLVAELDGEPVAFMLTVPDLNEFLADLDGKLFPFGFAKLLWRLNGGLSGRPKTQSIRVPLMGVVKRLQASRMASQLAFLMIEQTRETAFRKFGSSRAEIGWILEDNQGMISIADAIGASVNRVYRIFEKPL